MIEAIQRFVVELRKAGVRAAPSETIDAARAAQAVGVERRDVFRAALRSTLSKTRDDARAFDIVFDRFFAAPPPGRPGRRAGGGAAAAPGAGARRRPEAPDAEPEPGAGARRGDRTTPPRARPGRLKILLCPRRSDGAAPAMPGRRHPPRGTPQGHPARRAAPRPRPLHTPAALPGAMPPEPRRIELSRRLTPREEDLIAREVPRLIREIRLRAGRRLRRFRAGRPWTARLMRENIGTEGVPFVIPYRRRRRRRPRVVVLADVSWSVMRASSLFLVMARAFLQTGARASIYFFVDRCAEATDAVRRWKGPGAIPLERLLEGIESLDPRAASDYGRAFYQAARSRRGALRGAGRDTVLIVLGDARSNLRDPQAWAFEELSARCRRVIWLNPEPAARWCTGDSVLDAYLPHCDVVCEADDLEGLSRGIAEMARSL